MAPVHGGVWVDVGPLGDGVGLHVGAPKEGHGENLLQREAVVGEPRPMADGPLLPTGLLKDISIYRRVTQVSYVVTLTCIHPPVPQVWPPTACPHHNRGMSSFVPEAPRPYTTV